MVVLNVDFCTFHCSVDLLRLMNEIDYWIRVWVTYLIFILLLESELFAQTWLRGVLCLRAGFTRRKICTTLVKLMAEACCEFVHGIQLHYIRLGHLVVTMILKLTRWDCLISARHSCGALCVRRTGLAQLKRVRIEHTDPYISFSAITHIIVMRHTQTKFVFFKRWRKKWSHFFDTEC